MHYTFFRNDILFSDLQHVFTRQFTLRIKLIYFIFESKIILTNLIFGNKIYLN